MMIYIGLFRHSVGPNIKAIVNEKKNLFEYFTNLYQFILTDWNFHHYRPTICSFMILLLLIDIN